VVGYGINVRPPALPPELRDTRDIAGVELGRAIDRDALLAETLAALSRRYEDLLAGRFDAILDAVAPPRARRLRRAGDVDDQRWNGSRSDRRDRRVSVRCWWRVGDRVERSCRERLCGCDEALMLLAIDVGTPTSCSESSTTRCSYRAGGCRRCASGPPTSSACWSMACSTQQPDRSGEDPRRPLGSVVPPLTGTLRAMVQRYSASPRSSSSPASKRVDADSLRQSRRGRRHRIVNAVAAYEKFGTGLGKPLIVVDFGTATTLDAITAKGEYLGGAICPGVTISADALFQRAARLPRIDVRKPSASLGGRRSGRWMVGAVLGDTWGWSRAW